MRPGSDVCSSVVVDADAVESCVAGRSSEATMLTATAIFFALSDPTRFRILEALSVRELCVCDLASIVSVSQSGVSHQLRVLRDRGLVTFRREGQRAVYRLADAHVRDLISIGLTHAAEGREP